VLAAEKAGCWSAALTLYEQALKNEAAADSSSTAAAGQAASSLRAAAAALGSSGAAAQEQSGRLSAAKRGHLNCLLQLGHLENLLVVVDGWSSRCTGAASSSACCLYLACNALTLPSSIGHGHPASCMVILQRLPYACCISRSAAAWGMRRA
jgi:hypothetical protein